MKNSLRMDLRLFNRNLKKQSHEIHREALLLLCGDYRDYEFVKQIKELIVNLDYTSLESVKQIISFADCLVETVYSDAALHFAANQFAALIRKYPFPVRALKTLAENAAWDKFQESEAKCSAINEIYSSETSVYEAGISSDLIARMRAYIEFVLGTDLSINDFWDKCDFGPGASVGISGSATNKKRKLLSSWSVSPNALDYARCTLKAHPQIMELLLDPSEAVSDDFANTFDTVFLSRIDTVDYNKLIFVPKTTMVSRSIAVEPLLNSFLQKGIDQYMRERLKRLARIDLSDQEKNCRMALHGSFDKEDAFCTIDLSSASDSMSSNMVKMLLPPDWFYLLDRIRSKSYQYKDKVYPYSKFCSMGNGFCFPLQTLLFAAACHAVGAGRTGEDYRVYGDDIIVRKPVFESLIELLAQLGFSTNKSKTFGSGPFRESCGKDYYNGADVRPVILDYALDNIQSLFKFHNAFYRSVVCLHCGTRVQHMLLHRVPERFRLVAPDYSDVTDQAFRVGRYTHHFLASKFTRFERSSWCMSWLQIMTSPVDDRSNYGRNMREVGIAYLYSALSGSSSRNTFVHRRLSVTNIRRVAYGGPGSTWTPPVRF